MSPIGTFETCILALRMSAIYFNRDFAEIGGLISYGANFRRGPRRPADRMKRRDV
jgi:hypothetical protein